MALKLFQVDAFTDKPFAGNPAAVCLLTQPRDPGWMQNVAREMNLSETAFLLKEGDGYRLRWFTPAVEVELCGHATLASAHTLWEVGALKPTEQIRFHTLSGLLTAERQGDWIELNFPAQPVEPAPPPIDLTRALDASPVFVGRYRFDFLVELESEQTVRTLKPDFALVEKLPARGLVVTSRAATPEFDFVSRFFAPQVGVAEDPVTGSAHCALAPYWSGKLHKTEFVAYQASARGGVIRVRLDADRVRLGGQAVTVLRGELL
jgi:PhzF family phenazine biosynthesis protein